MTFSIVARDLRTGAFGVATTTGGPVVGSLVPHARAAVGAIATQASTNGLYAYDGLDLLSEGLDADAVLRRLTEADDGREHRQCIIVDREGRTAGWSGSECIQVAGLILCENVAVAGNMLTGSRVLDAMMMSFQAADGAIEDRLLAALAAGDRAGGDSRGVRSAALKVYTTEPYPSVDLRSDWSLTPILDLHLILAQVRGPDYADFFAGVPKRIAPRRG